MGDYLRWSPPMLEGAEDARRRRCSSRSTATSARCGWTSSSRAGREVLLALVRAPTSCSSPSAPASWTASASATRRCGRSTRGSSTARSRATARTGRRATARATTSTTSRSPACSASPATPTARRSSPRGQIADLGGGALMAAFGILAALRERDRSGEGQLVDVSMTDGTLSWLAMVAARLRSPRASSRAAAGSSSAAACSATALPLRRRLGHARRAGAEVLGACCPGVGREDLVEQPVRRRPGSDTHRAVEAVFATRTRDEWAAFAAEHDCCLEPVLELDQALASELVRARGMVVELDQPGAGAGAPARRAGEAVAHAAGPGAAPARRWASTPRRC